MLTRVLGFAIAPKEEWIAFFSGDLCFDLCMALFHFFVEYRRSRQSLPDAGLYLILALSAKH